VTTKRKVMVCDSCLTEACWQGVLMCENARRAGVTERPAEVIEGSGRPVRGRALPQMVSIRFSPPLLAEARRFADARGVTVSEVVRRAVTDYLEENSAAPPCLGAQPSAGQP
jgi:hypothetical protein